MCMPASKGLMGQLDAKIGGALGFTPPSLRVARQVDRKVFGYDDRTQYMGGGGQRSSGRMDSALIFQQFVKGHLPGLTRTPSTPSGPPAMSSQGRSQGR